MFGIITPDLLRRARKNKGISGPAPAAVGNWLNSRGMVTIANEDLPIAEMTIQIITATGGHLRDIDTYMEDSFSVKRRTSLFAAFAVYLASLLLSVVTSAHRASADTYISPELIQISTPVYRPDSSEFEMPLGEYVYTVSWQGIPAATVTARVEQRGTQYYIDTVVKTYSAIDIFYKLRYRAQGWISAVDFYPSQCVIEQQENSRNRRTEMNFLPSGEIVAVREDLAKDEVKRLTFDPNNFTLDPFSAAFLARGQRWEKGETKEFDTFNGKSRYHIKLYAEDLVYVDVEGEKRGVWVIVPTVKNLSNPEQSSKLRKAKIYVLADKSRDIVKIVSSVFIGSVTTQLDSFTPFQRVPAGTQIAKSKTSHIVK
ncbi:MAG: DUF3108 domain-containing protein [Deltaproteobacteria bacterium]|nr:DUF3108 domain-containing protein [Deltaproteobacteria bacterium]